MGYFNCYTKTTDIGMLLNAIQRQIFIINQKKEATLVYRGVAANHPELQIQETLRRKAMCHKLMQVEEGGVVCRHRQ